jgi:hypothetical protein
VTFIATNRAINAGGNAMVIGSLQGRGCGPAASSRRGREYCHGL